MSSSLPPQFFATSMNIHADENNAVFKQRRNSFDISDGPPPYEEVIGELSQNVNASTADQELYPFSDLKRISNRGLLKNLRKYHRQITPSNVESNKQQLRPSLILNSIIEELSKDSNGRANLSYLSDTLMENESLILQEVESHPLILTIYSDQNSFLIIELNPIFKFCLEYGTNGCVGCRKLHLCSDYLKGLCDGGAECVLEHNLMTDHNRRIYLDYFLAGLSPDKLYRITARAYRKATPPTICLQYNKGSCNYDMHCFYLHLCNEYVQTLGSCPASELCLFNHDISDQQCSKIFSEVGIMSLRAKESDLLQMIALNSEEKDIRCSNLQNPKVSKGICTIELENDTSDLQLTSNEEIDEEVSSDSEPEKCELEEKSSFQDESTEASFNQPMYNEGFHEESQSLREIPGDSQAISMKVVVSNRRRKSHHQNRAATSSSLYIEQQNFIRSERRKAHYEEKRDMKKQRKIHKMERKVEKMQSKIDYLKSSSIPNDAPKH